ncbi:MAG TPA: DUF1549 and DUF1553 domain-containing protein [Bryobacteraceae bacterium]|nr:DUF1549 and DUF1553 domain-containing protein [Bryobacteraceae bacterium]
MRAAAMLLILGAATVGLYSAETVQFTPAQKSFWSLQPVTKPALPAVRNLNWLKTPIDAFILAKLEEQNLKPNPPADKVTLLRRASIDITGLQPTQEEITAFVNDSSSDAWIKVVDRLLASPAYGERWGRHWLDVVRYADSNGYKADETRPNMWRYRDYVIQSLNNDKPYDRFIKEQIAGDELYPGDPEALVAMGYNRNWIDETNAASMFVRRQETLDDMTTVTGQAFLGLTYGCARCHNHKYDPILQKDYYRLQAFFANTVAGDGPLPIKDAAAHQKYEEQKAIYDEKTKDIRAEMAKIIEPLRTSKMESGIKTFEDEVKTAVLMEPAKRTPMDWVWYKTVEPRIFIDEEPDARTLRTLKGDNAKRYAELKKQLAEFDSLKPAPLPQGQFMVDISAKAPPTYVLLGGNVGARGEEVQPGFLSVLDPSDAKYAPPAGMDSTGRRTALAQWLADPKNPLVPRVIVNRIWHYHFGRGIVATPGDFGRMGARPTHPELLDYLTSNFIENGWSMKKMHRMILLSSAYQQSSTFNEKSAAVDADDKLLWRWPRRRMEAEAVRDSMLQVSGLLDQKMGGPGVFPPLPAGTTTELSATAAAGGWRNEKDPAQINRRSVYIFVRRNLRYPMMQEFDSANNFDVHSARTNTVTPSQTLGLMNFDLVVNWAQSFAGRVLNDNGLTETAQIDRAYRLAYGRPATADEQAIAASFFKTQMPIMQARLEGTSKPPLPANVPEGMDPARAAAWVDLCQMLLNSNEFLYIN